MFDILIFYIMDKEIKILQAKGNYDKIAELVESSAEPFFYLDGLNKEELIKILDLANPREKIIQVNIHYNVYDDDFTIEELEQFYEKGYYIQGYNCYPWFVVRYTGSKEEQINLTECCPDYLNSLEGFFKYCVSLKKLSLFNNNHTYYDRYISAEGMFQGCMSLKEIDMRHFETFYINNMSNMFDGCSSIEELDLSSFDTSNVVDMSNMFGCCFKLKKLDLSGFDLSNVINMSNMFFDCIELRKLRLNGLGHNEECTELDLSNSPFLDGDSIQYLIDNAFDRSKVGYEKSFKLKITTILDENIRYDSSLIEKAKEKGFELV